MLGQNNPDLMLARQQLEQSGAMTPGLRLRLVGQGVDPSSIEAQATQGALSAPQSGSGPNLQGALPTAAPMSEEGPATGKINRGGTLPDWAPPVGKGHVVPSEVEIAAQKAIAEANRLIADPTADPAQSPVPGTPVPGASGSPAAAPAGPGPATSSPQPALQQAAPQQPAAPGQPQGQPPAAAPPDPVQIAERVQRAPEEQKTAITKQLESKGIDVEKAFNEWMEKLGGEKAPDLKLTKEDKGLFLMEFGLRMMTASARTGALDAAGQAGLGTLGSYKAEMDRRRATATDQTDKARAGALALTGLEIDAQAKGPRGSDVLADDSGFAFFVGPNGEPVFLTDEQGNKVKLDPNMRSRGYGQGASVFQQKMDAWIAHQTQNGKLPETPKMRRDALAYAGSGMTEDQLRDAATMRANDARLALMKAGGIVNGRAVFSWTPEEWNKWEDEYVETLIRRARGDSLTAEQEQFLDESDVASQGTGGGQAGGRGRPGLQDILGDDEDE